MQGKWTIVFDDKTIINQSVLNDLGFGTPYKIDDDAFWSDSKWDNVHAIQYVDDQNDHADCVEMKPGTFGRNKTWAEAGFGNFTDLFIVKWDAAHLAQLQETWDNDNNDGETAEQKINRLGARPTSYTSS
jgi:hypothetical protein|tara:strand:- start:4634 stop:5023 length:390 start_codon:yes stop_codon:yes gene_type:complete